MAIYPHAVADLVALDKRMDPPITATQVVLHTAVSTAHSLSGWFASAAAGGVEAHFYVDHDGTVRQMRDTAYQADAQSQGNMRAISIETWDGGKPATTPWTPEQLDALSGLLVWVCRTHGIPAVQCPAWDEPGIGWHRQFAQWNPHGHVCPGPAREAQIPALIASVHQVLNPPKPAPKPVTTPAHTQDRPDRVPAGLTPITPEDDIVSQLITVRPGHVGKATLDVQGLLYSHGHLLSADGKYGPQTQAAVKAVQKSAHITADGIVGPQTWRALLRLPIH